MMNETDKNKQIIRESILTVWERGNLAALPYFWTEDCINHAMPEKTANTGLDVLRTYHEQFFDAFTGFSDAHIEILNQIAEADQVVTHIRMRATQTGEFSGIPASGKTVFLLTIRIDRLRDGKIAEHWSVADLAGLMQQIQA